MTSRVVTSEQDRAALVQLVGARKLPFAVNITQGKKRSSEQNRLQRQWIDDISEQLGDQTPEEVRGECKLRFGVPILRAEDAIFREKYDRIIKPLPYETKIEMMMEPFDFAVTRLMDTSQKTRYLDDLARFYTRQGVRLTETQA